MAAVPIEQHVGQWVLIPLEVGFESTDSAGDLGRFGADAATVAVTTKTMNYPGYVHAIAVNAVGGNFSGCTFLVQVAGSADADSSFAPGAAAVGRQIYKSTDVTFVAGDTLAVEIDALTTFRDCVVTLLVALNVGG